VIPMRLVARPAVECWSVMARAGGRSAAGVAAAGGRGRVAAPPQAALAFPSAIPLCSRSPLSADWDRRGMPEPIDYATPRPRSSTDLGCFGCLVAVVGIAVAVVHYVAARVVYQYRWSGPDGPNGTLIDFIVSFPIDSMDEYNYVFPPRDGRFQATSLANALIWGASVAGLICLLAWRRRAAARHPGK
jgi:hypothetical protein